MKKRQGKGFLGFMFFMAIFWIVGTIIVLLSGGNLTGYDEYGEAHSLLEYFYDYALIIFAILLVAIIPNFYFFSLTCLFLTIFGNIVFIGKIKIFSVVIMWGIEMLATGIFSAVSYMGKVKPYRPPLCDRLKHIPDGYKIMSKAARKEWIDFLSSINPHGEDEEE